MPSATMATPSSARKPIGKPGSHQAPTTARSSAPKTNPPIAPFDRLFRADGGRQRTATERAPRVVLRRVAGDHREHQEEQRLASRLGADRDHRPDRQPEVQHRKDRRRGAAERVALAFPGRQCDRRQRHEPRDEDGVEHHAAEHQAIQDPHARAHAETCQHRGGTRGSERNGVPPAAASFAYSTNARTSSVSATARNISGGANQTTATATRDEDRAAENPRHLTPSATGDGLMPPYRRSRFW